MDRARQAPDPQRRRARAVAPALAGISALLVLGPALGPGVVLTYDLAWSPDARLTPFALGVGTPAPRAVPSDAVAVALGWLVGAGPAQALVLLGILVLAGWGTGRLASGLAAGSTLAAGVGAVAGVWNPFVLERLVVGQWTVLLGYAVTPHLLLLARRARTDRTALPWLAGLLALAGTGGANTLLLAGLAVVPVLLAPRPAVRALAVTALVTAGSAAVWAVPALGAGVRSSDAGARAFAPRSDTPFGAFVSLLSGGGFWNPATHPSERGVPLLAGLATLLAVLALATAGRALVRSGSGPLLLPAVLGAVLAGLAVADPGEVWSSAVVSLPGGGVLRDAQKLVVPLVVLSAAGTGALAAALARRPAVGRPLAVLVAALPVLLLPGLAWGAQGRVDAVRVPDDLRAAATTLSQAPDGVIGLLPWSQYRRYDWNGDRVSLTLVPRMVAGPVLYDDSLPLRDGRVAGEDPAAAAVGRAITDGVDPVRALTDAGVRYLVVERGAGDLPGAAAVAPPGARVLVDGPHVLVVDVGGTASTPVAGPALVTGWAVTATTWGAILVVVGFATARAVSRRRGGRGYRLVQSPP